MTSSSGMAYPAGSAGFAGLITVQDAGRRAITRKEAYPVSGEAYDEAALLLAEIANAGGFQFVGVLRVAKGANGLVAE